MGCGSSTTKETLSNNKNSNHNGNPKIKTNQPTERKQVSKGTGQSGKQTSNKSSSGIPSSNGNGQIITLGIGDFGSKSLGYFIEEIAREHGLIGRETLKTDSASVQFPNRFFSENNGGYKSRSILYDNDSIYLNGVSQSDLGQLVSNNCIFNNRHENASIYQHCAKTQVDDVLESIRKEMEKCDFLSGFIFFSSYFDGLSSGVSSAVAQKLSQDNPTKIKVVLNGTKHPSSLKDEEIFNTITSFSGMVEYIDFVTDFNIELLTGKADFYGGYSDQEGCQYEVMARIIAEMTSPMRFSAGSGLSLNKLVTSMVTFPRMHFSDIIFAVGDDEKKLALASLSDNYNLTGTKHNTKLLNGFEILRGHKLNVDSYKKIYNSNSKGNAPLLCSSHVCNVDGLMFVNSAIRLTISEAYTNLLGDYIREFDNKFTKDGSVVESKYPGVEIVEIDESRMNLQDLISEYEIQKEE